MAEDLLGSIRLFSFDFAPRDWALCDGSLLSVMHNTGLYAIIGNKFGGDGVKTFALPDMREKAPIEGIHFYICLNGMFPARQ